MNKLNKRQLKPGNMLNPTPVVMVSCGETPDEYNIITIAWCGTLCSDPPMCYISVRPERHSYDIIKRNMEFVINLTTEDMYLFFQFFNTVLLAVCIRFQYRATGF